MLLFHSIYTPVSSTGVNPVLTPPRAAVFISSLQTLSLDCSGFCDDCLGFNTRPSESCSSLSCQNPIDCRFDQTSFSTKPLTTRNSLTGEDVGGMRENEGQNAVQGEKSGKGREKTLGVENKALFLLCYQKCTVVLCEENMKTARCLHPVDGGSLHSLPSGFG